MVIEVANGGRYDTVRMGRLCVGCRMKILEPDAFGCYKFAEQLPT